MTPPRENDLVSIRLRQRTTSWATLRCSNLPSSVDSVILNQYLAKVRYQIQRYLRRRKGLIELDDAGLSNHQCKDVKGKGWAKSRCGNLDIRILGDG